MGIEFNWRCDGAPIAHAASVPPWRSRPVRRRLLALTLAALAVAGALYWRAQRGLAAARADLGRVIGGEVLALQTGRSDLFFASLDGSYPSWVRYHEENWAREAAWYAARPHARPFVAGLRLGPDRAQVTVGLADGEQEWQAVWFFERVDGHWRHAPPPTEFWGDSTDFETAHLSLTAQGPDREAAARLAPELEDLYGELAALYPPAPTLYSDSYDDDVPRARMRAPSRIALRSSPYGGSGSSGDYFPSPQLALEMWTAQERASELARSARLALARAVILQALGRMRPDAGDWWLVEALSLWHARAWRPAWQAEVKQALANGTSGRLLDVQSYGAEPTLYWKDGSTPLERTAVQPLAYTLGEYLGTTFAPEQLGAALRAIASGGSSWEALAQVLGLDRASLEAGWKAFLQAHYAG